MNFQQKLTKIIKKNNSLLCIGLDPEAEKLPKHLRSSKEKFFLFNKQIIDETANLVCAYKPNIAFYEACGIEGLTSLKKTIEYLKSNYPHIPIILDAKRADIGNTARMYAKALFEYWEADATTIYPYLGFDTVLPFLEYKDQCTILLIKTSNPDAKTFLDQEENKNPFYIRVAKEIKKWNFDNIGVFVGATYPKELSNIRKLFPHSPILTAGLGAQGGQTEKVVKAGIDKEGGNLICNSSREIIYAGNGKDFAKESAKVANKVRDIINKYR